MVIVISGIFLTIFIAIKTSKQLCK